MTTRVVTLEVHTVRVPLVRPFVTAVRRVDAIDAVVVELTDSDGRHGWGEAAASWRVTGESPESIRAVTSGPLADAVIGGRIDDLPELSAALARSVQGNPAARSAVECALYDLAAQRAGLPLTAFLGGSDAPVRTDMTVSVADTGELVRTAAQHCAAGFHALKLKVGGGGDDARSVLAVRDAVGPGVALRVDANQGWDREQAVQIIRFWEDHGVRLEFVEQPVAATSFDDLAWVTRQVDTPILADESVWTSRDLRCIVERRAADLINIKLAKTGGIAHALTLATTAAENDLGVVVGCMMESQVGIAAAAAVAGSLGVACANRAHDLDAGLWLAASPVRGGTTYRGETVVPGGGAGLGITGLAAAGRAA